MRADITKRTPLAVYRLAQSLSQSDLASAAGVSRVTISGLETRSHRPRLATAEAIADALGVPVSMVFPREET